MPTLPMRNLRRKEVELGASAELSWASHPGVSPSQPCAVILTARQLQKSQMQFLFQLNPTLIKLLYSGFYNIAEK